MIKNIYILRQMFHMPSLENRDGGYRSFMDMCVVLLCLVVCMALLASFFLPSSSLINMYTVALEEERCSLLFICS